MDFAASQQQLKAQLIADRRFFHQLAEPAWLEYRTSLEIAARLLSLGWAVQLGRALHGTDRLGLPSPEDKATYASKSGLSKTDLVTLFQHLQKVARARVEAGPEARGSEVTSNQARQAPLDDAVLTEILDSYTGVVADWDSGRPGPYLLLRFDIDALALAESKEPYHRPQKEGFAQTNGQACHACAHDGHIALGLALAQLISQVGQLQGRIRLVFQPAEEGCRGAYSMVQKGLADGVDFLLACHLGLGMPSNSIGLATQGFLASQKFSLDLQGRAAHAASAPETGKNALLAAASLALNLHTLTQYGKTKAFLNVGKIEAGNLANVIADQARLEFELRATEMVTMQDLEDKMRAMVKGHCSARDLSWQMERHGCAEALDTAYLADYLEQGARLQETLAELGFKTYLGPDFAASEDIVTWMNKVWQQGGQALHLMLGAETKTAHHHPAFDFREEDLLPSLKVLLASLAQLSPHTQLVDLALLGL